MTPRIHHATPYRSPVSGIEIVSLTSNHHFPRHSHDQFGIGVISSGAHRSWSGVGQVIASAGDVIMVNPGEMHDGAPLDGSPRAWRMIYLKPDLLAREVENEVVRSREVVRPVAIDPPLARKFAKLFASLTSTPPDALEVQEHLLRSLIHMLGRHSARPFPSPALSPSVSRARERLDSAPAQSASLTELAALSGVSRFQLLRAFMRETGTTPHAYQTQRRVLRARQLLADGQTPAVASLEAGFADQSHMTRAFVRQLGVTPSRYRAAIPL